MTDPIEQAFGRYNVAVTTGRNVLPSANAYSALLDERQMAVERAILHHHPDVVRLVLAARAVMEHERGFAHSPPSDADGCRRCAMFVALDPFKEVQE